MYLARATYTSLYKNKTQPIANIHFKNCKLKIKEEIFFRQREEDIDNFID